MKVHTVQMTEIFRNHQLSNFVSKQNNQIGVASLLNRLTAAKYTTSLYSAWQASRKVLNRQWFNPVFNRIYTLYYDFYYIIHIGNTCDQCFLVNNTVVMHQV